MRGLWLGGLGVYVLGTSSQVNVGETLEPAFRAEKASSQQKPISVNGVGAGTGFRVFRLKGYRQQPGRCAYPLGRRQ